MVITLKLILDIWLMILDLFLYFYLFFSNNFPNREGNIQTNTFGGMAEKTPEVKQKNNNVFVA